AVIEHPLDAEFEATTLAHDSAPTNEGNWLIGWLFEKDFAVFETCGALARRLITARRERSSHARASVGIVLQPKPRRDRGSIPRACEARIIQAHDDDDAIANDPFIDCADRSLAEAAPRICSDVEYVA